MIAFDATGHYAIKLHSNMTYEWMVEINCSTPNPTKCLSSTNGFSDSDGTNIHSAYTLQDSPKYTLYFVLDISTGSNVTTIKKTDSDQDVEISSLYIDSNGVTWISLYANTSPRYSELISYDMSSGNSTTYKQTGVAYLYQFVDPNNNNYWYGVALNTITTTAILDGMDYIDILNVTTTSGGLIDADEDFNTSTPFPTENSWVTETDWDTENGRVTARGYNFALTTVDLPAALLSNSTGQPDTNSTTNVDNNSTQNTTTNSNPQNNTTDSNPQNTTTDSNPQNTTTSSNTQNNNNPAIETTTNNTKKNITASTKVASTMTVAIISVTVGVAAVAHVVSSATVVSRVGVEAAGSTSSTGSSQSFWAIVNLYQDIVLLPMLGTYLGDNFIYYITEFELALFDFQFLKFVQVPVF